MEEETSMLKPEETAETNEGELVLSSSLSPLSLNTNAQGDDDEEEKVELPSHNEVVESDLQEKVELPSHHNEVLESDSQQPVTEGVERSLSPPQTPQTLPQTQTPQTPSLDPEADLPVAAGSSKPVLQRTPSIVSECLSKPDPPSIIEHVHAVDYSDEELLTRGIDASERVSHGSGSDGDGDGDGDEQDSKDFRRLHDHDVMQDGQQPLYINVPSFDADAEEDTTEENARHRQLVDSFLHDEGLSGSPLASVLEHEVLLPTLVPGDTTRDRDGLVDNDPSNPHADHHFLSQDTSTVVQNNNELKVEQPVELDSPFRVPAERRAESSPRASVPVPLHGSNSPKVYDAPLDPSTSTTSRLPSRPGPDDDVDFLPRAMEPSRVVRQQHQKQQQQQQRRLHAFQTPVASSYQPSSSYGGYTNNNNTHHQPHQQHHFMGGSAMRGGGGGGGGRRKIRLRLQEEVRQLIKGNKRSILGHLRTRSRQMMWGSRDLNSNNSNNNNNNNNSGYENDNTYNSSNTNLEINNNKSYAITIVDRGSITVSWFEGTSAIELQEHVRSSVARKLCLEKGIELADMRILDESSDPPEEIVLSPYIPDGSKFILRYSTRDISNDGTVTPLSIYSGRAPDSPSAEPSPRTSRQILGALSGDFNANQLALLRKQLNALKLPQGGGGAAAHAAHIKEVLPADETDLSHAYRRRNEEEKKDEGQVLAPLARSAETQPPDESEFTENPDFSMQGGGDDDDDDDQQSKTSKVLSELEDDDDVDDMMLHSEDPIEARLRQITELLIVDRQKRRNKYSSRKREKRQVIFVLANYFVLFLSLIAISAEIHSRAPGWLASLENHLIHVHDCAKDKDALFQCVSNGDFAGLVASILLYFSRSVATRRFFLFGFDNPRKLWNVVYECLVTSFCWGFSYLFIRRGLNPDTRPQFVQKYWKDAVYGSLAGFNAAFMKHVLKNLIPQEAVEDVLRDRQIKILSWLPSFRG